MSRPRHKQAADLGLKRISLQATLDRFTARTSNLKLLSRPLSTKHPLSQWFSSEFSNVTYINFMIIMVGARSTILTIRSFIPYRLHARRSFALSLSP
jgi:hypothetical protein